MGNNKLNVLEEITHKNKRILIVDFKVEETNSVFVNLYNPNTETKQVATLLDLLNMLETIKNCFGKDLVLPGNFDFFFDTSLDLYRSKPTLKKKSIAKFLELTENFDLCET